MLPNGIGVLDKPKATIWYEVIGPHVYFDWMIKEIPEGCTWIELPRSYFDCLPNGGPYMLTTEEE